MHAVRDHEGISQWATAALLTQIDDFPVSAAGSCQLAAVVAVAAATAVRNLGLVGSTSPRKAALQVSSVWHALQR